MLRTHTHQAARSLNNKPSTPCNTALQQNDVKRHYRVAQLEAYLDKTPSLGWSNNSGGVRTQVVAISAAHIQSCSVTAEQSSTLHVS